MPTRALIRLALVMTMAVSATGCLQHDASSSEAVGNGPVFNRGTRIQAYLDRSGLHRAAGTRDATRTVELTGDTYDLFETASQRAGLDLSGYRGRRVGLVEVQLEERSRSDDSTSATALFLTDGASIVGVALNMPGLSPSIGPINDLSELAVPGFSPTNLDFRGVSGVEVFGPHGDGGWKRRSVLSRDAAQTFIGMLRSSSRHSGERHAGSRDEVHMAVLTWDSGAKVRVQIVTPQGTEDTFLNYDIPSFWRVYYVPPSGLKDFVTQALENTE